MSMSFHFLRHTFFVFAVLVLLLTGSQAWDRSGVTTFATLPAGSTSPEGITADKDGNIYTATFDMARAGKPGQIIVFGKDGKLRRVLEISGASNLLLDLAFHPKTGELLVVDFGGKQILKVDPMTGISAVFMRI